MDAQFFLRLPQITQIHIFFRRRQGSFNESIPRLHLDIDLQPLQRNRSVHGVDLILGVIIDPPARVGRLYAEFFGEKIRGLITEARTRGQTGTGLPDCGEVNIMQMTGWS